MQLGACSQFPEAKLYPANLFADAMPRRILYYTNIAKVERRAKRI